MVSQSGTQGRLRHPIVESSGEQEVEIRAGKTPLEGTLAILDGAAGLVLFAHGSGSSRQSPRNGHVARVLQQHKIGTLLSMDSSSCGMAEKGSKTVAGELLGTDGEHKQTEEVLCQEYLLAPRNPLGLSLWAS